MILRLSGWQRLGIVASVLWALGAGLAMRINDASVAQEAYNLAYNTCIDQKRAQRVDPTTPLGANIVSGCRNEGRRAHQLFLANSWEAVAFVALVPIPFGWLLAYMFRGVWRWIKCEFTLDDSR